MLAMLLFSFFALMVLANGHKCRLANPKSGLSLNKAWMPALEKDPDAACDWKVTKAELMFDEVALNEFEPPHFVIRLTTDQPIQDNGKNNPIMYDVVEDPFEERLTGYPKTKHYPDSNRVAAISGPFSEELDGGAKKEVTLGRLLDCVGVDGLHEKYGQCIFLTLRVFRFLLGGCKCGACNPGNKEDMAITQVIGPSLQVRVTGDEKGLKKILGTVNRLLAMAEVASVGMKAVRFFKPEFQIDIKGVRLAAEQLKMQLYSISGMVPLTPKEALKAFIATFRSLKKQLVEKFMEAATTEENM